MTTDIQTGCSAACEVHGEEECQAGSQTGVAQISIPQCCTYGTSKELRLAERVPALQAETVAVLVTT